MATAGYSGTPLPRKLGIKPGHRVLVVSAPPGFALANVPVAEQVVKRLQELEKPGASVGIAAVLARAREFSAAAQKFDARAAAVRANFAAGKGDESAARRLNRAMKRISRLTVPLMSSAIGKYGHDPYGYTPQGTMIPALYDIAHLATLGLRISSLDFRRFCKRHGIQRDEGAGRPRVRFATTAVR